MSYRWDADEYARHSAAQLEWARALLAKLDLRCDEAVLDLGCGDGKVTAELAALVPAGRVLGVDSSRTMLDLARERFGHLANLAFAEHDARALPFVAEFDAVFSNAALHWVVDHAPVLAGIARALRPSGRILLQMGGRGNAAEILSTIEPLLAEPPWSEHFAGFSFPYGFHGADEYRGWLRDAGLEPRRAELLAVDMQQPGADGLAGWVRTTWLPYTSRLPEPLREPFIAAVVGRYLAAHPPDADGTVHVAMVRLEVEATKPG